MARRSTAFDASPCGVFNLRESFKSDLLGLSLEGVLVVGVAFLALDFGDGLRPLGVFGDTFDDTTFGDIFDLGLFLAEPGLALDLGLPLTGVGVFVLGLPLTGVGVLVLGLPLTGVGVLFFGLALTGVGVLVLGLPLTGVGVLFLGLALAEAGVFGDLALAGEGVAALGLSSTIVMCRGVAIEYLLRFEGVALGVACRERRRLGVAPRRRGVAGGMALSKCSGLN